MPFNLGYVSILQTQALTEVEEEEDKFEALERWLKDNGASFPHLYMKRYSENYRGVHVRTTLGVRAPSIAPPSNSSNGKYGHDNVPDVTRACARVCVCVCVCACVRVCVC